MSPDEDSAVDVVDLHQIPVMETVSSTDGLDNLESDDDSVTTGASEDSSVIATAQAFSTKTGSAGRKGNPPVNGSSVEGATGADPRTKRRTRGMSFLPVRQSTAGIPSQITSPAGSTSPPTTPSPLRSLHPPSFSQHSDTGRSKHDTSSGHLSGGISQPSTPTAADTNENILAAYMNQLAAKEARVVDLRNTITRLQQELKSAETDLSAYKDNGKKLAQLVNLPDNHNIAKASAGEAQKDVLGMGRRVVDEIGTQFWSFLEDVKSATMGNNDFPGQVPGKASSVQAHPAGAIPSTAIPDPISRSPSPRRQLNAKRSIQDFLKNRSHSPIRRVRSPSPERRELAEHRASQRLRESERLTKKLSHIDLRAPSPTRSQQQESRDGAL